MTAARHSSGGRSTEIATTCGRGTITSWASLSAKSKTLYSSSCSACSTTPDSPACATIRRMSSSECATTPAGAGSMPKSLVNAFAEAWRNQTSGIRDEKDALDGKGHPECGLLVLRERDRLGDELAERDMQVRDDREGER